MSICRVTDVETGRTRTMWIRDAQRDNDGRDLRNKKPYRSTSLKKQAKASCQKLEDGRYVAPHVPVLHH